jgi:hypothetical protein
MHVFLIKQPNLDPNVNLIIESVGKIRKNKKAVEILSKIKDEII